MINKGVTYVFTGDGKGKTSAALGVALRMLLIGKKVVWVSWYKSPDWDISEKKFSNAFSDNLEMYWFGKGFYIKKSRSAKVNQSLVFDYEIFDNHKKAAHDAVAFIMELLGEINKGKKEVELIVLDEINQTVKDKLLKKEDIEKIINNRGRVNLVLTGRSFPRSLVEKVDLLSEIKKVKHPFDSGVMAIKGLDF